MSIKLNDNRLCKDKDKAEIYITTNNLKDPKLHCKDIQCRSRVRKVVDKKWNSYQDQCKRCNYKTVKSYYPSTGYRRPKWCPLLKRTVTNE